MTRVRFLGFDLHCGSHEEVSRWLLCRAQRTCGEPSYVVHVNVHTFYHLVRSPQALQRLEKAAFFLLDGIGMRLGVRATGLGWLPNACGTDFFPIVMHGAAEMGLSVYFLGGSEGVVRDAVHRTVANFPNLKIAGFHCGYFHRRDEAEVVARIQATHPDLLLISRGSPPDVNFILDNRHQFSASLIWDTGGLLDVVSGWKPRAPLAWRRHGLEWLFRFLLEPRRMWRRNLIEAPWFLAHVIVHGMLRWTKEQ